MRAYLDELGLPRHDVHSTCRASAGSPIEAIAALPDEELAARRRGSAELMPAVRGAHDLNEAREFASTILTPAGLAAGRGARTLERFRELRERATELDADREAIIRELKAVGGNLRAVRRALTGRDSGPELWSVIAALPREETLRRIDGAL